VIATRNYVCLQKKRNLTLSVWFKKETWLFGIWLQAWVVSDCKKLKCVIAKSAGLFLWLQKKEKNNWSSVWLQLICVSYCNKELCAFAKKKKPDFVCVVEKGNLVVWNMIASLGSKWLQKPKVCHCKICWFVSVTAKKKNNWSSVWLQLICVSDCN
jgi:hypothetical protein